MLRTTLLLLIALSWFLKSASAADLTKLASEAAEGFTPISQESLAANRQELVSRSARLAALINRQPDGGDAWRAYLKWEAVDALADPNVEPNLAALQASLARINSGAAGLEQPAVRSAAESLSRYINAAALFASKNQADRFQQAVEAVPSLLAKDAAITNEWQGYLLERRLALLADLGQAEQLVQQARGGFSKSNVLLTISESMLDQLIRRPVASRSRIRDRILGARVVGTGDTQGWVSVNLRPAWDAARLDFSLHGSIHSRTTSYKGPVAVRSTANTPISGTKTLRLTPEAFYLMPASASAQTRSRTQSISKVGGGLGSGLIEKLASRRVAEDRPLADRISSGRAATKVAASLDRQIEEAARRLRRRYDNAWTKPLARYGAPPQRFTLSSTEDTLRASLLQAGRGQLGASSPPPPASRGDLVAQLHASAVQNLATAVLGGATISKAGAQQPTKLSAKLPDWLDQLLDKKPAAQDTGADDNTTEFKPWKITLRRVRPLSVKIEQGAVVVILHTNQIQSGSEQFRGWDLIVGYAPTQVDGRWVLQRRGEVDARRTRPDNRRGWEIRTRDRPVYSNLIKSVRDGGSLPTSVDLGPFDLSKLNLSGASSLVVQSVELSEEWLSIGLDTL